MDPVVSKPRRRPKRLRAKRRPPLTTRQILAWADAHFARTGKWPQLISGVIAEADGGTWNAVQKALYNGTRGLSPGGNTLARFLAQHRGVRNLKALPPYTETQILAWADAFLARTGFWPTPHSGAVADDPNETWHRINAALCMGLRGLPGGSSLSRLLAQERSRRNRKALPRLSVALILAWADTFRQKTGRWPARGDGLIEGSAGDTWAAVDAALHNGCRGFPGGDSLAQVLATHRGARNKKALPRLQVKTILAWARDYRAATGHWPREKSGPILSAPGETWSGINAALRTGLRGLPGGTTLYQLIQRRRGVR